MTLHVITTICPPPPFARRGLTLRLAFIVCIKAAKSNRQGWETSFHLCALDLCQGKNSNRQYTSCLSFPYTYAFSSALYLPLLYFIWVDISKIIVQPSRGTYLISLLAFDTARMLFEYPMESFHYRVKVLGLLHPLYNKRSSYTSGPI